MNIPNEFWGVVEIKSGQYRQMSHDDGEVDIYDSSGKEVMDTMTAEEFLEVYKPSEWGWIVRPDWVEDV